MVKNEQVFISYSRPATILKAIDTVRPLGNAATLRKVASMLRVGESTAWDALRASIDLGFIEKKGMGKDSIYSLTANGREFLYSDNKQTVFAKVALNSIPYKIVKEELEVKKIIDTESIGRLLALKYKKAFGSSKMQQYGATYAAWLEYAGLASYDRKAKQVKLKSEKEKIAESQAKEDISKTTKTIEVPMEQKALAMALLEDASILKYMLSKPITSATTKEIEEQIKALNKKGSDAVFPELKALVNLTANHWKLSKNKPEIIKMDLEELIKVIKALVA